MTDVQNAYDAYVSAKAGVKREQANYELALADFQRAQDTLTAAIDARDAAHDALINIVESA